MADRLLFDTDVLIDYLRDEPAAVGFISHLTERPAVSAITIAELYAGVRDGEERTALDSFITSFEILPVTEAIARRGGLVRRDYHRSHNVSLPDALIAATCEVHGLPLVTLNRRHYPMATNLQVPYTKA
jgi:predicted nucleic acid-binding protein